MSRVGQGVHAFVTVRYRKRIRNGNCSGTLVYTNLIVDKDLDKRYGEVLVCLSVFQTNSGQLDDDVKDREVARYFAWVAPVVYSAVPFNNNPLYLESSRTPGVM